MCFFSFSLSAGYCFLLFQDEMSVQHLIEACVVEDQKFYWCVSSPTMKDKAVSTSVDSITFSETENQSCLQSGTTEVAIERRLLLVLSAL